MSNLVYVVAGIYLMVMGFTSRVFVHEAGVAPIEIERRKAQATRTRRGIVIAVGLLLLLYGTYGFSRWYHA
ncbi:hypothetical protein [Acidipila sp. EB88]|uniref:hypothetical protein n=1 Tax=Acidipila sp. EB88 TaxID=2305226 RepID=UPI000F5E2F7A|nr:hypothetical protein [Acidipila sp. EB88]RRA48386.1 hypothetical protein D1Y84_08880 [Acidipila sp. EB88]